MEPLQTTLPGPIDLVFSDAAKGHYLTYLDLVLGKLCPGAIVIADNILFRGWVCGCAPPRRFRTIVDRLRQYLNFVITDPRFVTAVYPVGDGIAVSRYQEESLLEKN
ncbi:MAG: hypothetical protein P4N41_25280 [Negativicutes bacterium]|nr:hypothetical protein [Negativicutes bacterium]